MENNRNKPEKSKCSNLVLEIDKTANAGYIYLSGYSKNNPPKVKSTKSLDLDTKYGIINIDYTEDGKMAGIEILNISEYLDI